MPSSSNFALVFAALLGSVLPLSITLYAAFWAFRIRKSLASRIYRKHALWLGIMSLFFASNLLPNLAQNLYISAYNAFGVLVVMAWIDATIPIARLSDPLLRNPFHWEKIRLLVWPIIVVSSVGSFYSASWLPSTSPIAGLSLVGTFGALIVALVIIAVETSRSKDPLLRRSLVWIVSFGVSELLQFTIYVILSGSPFDLANSDIGFWLNYSWPSIPSALLVVAGFYALYKSVRSLAPVNKLVLSNQN